MLKSQGKETVKRKIIEVLRFFLEPLIVLGLL